MKLTWLFFITLFLSQASADPKDGIHDKDQFQNFSELRKVYVERRDYSVRICINPSGILIAAIHGGNIEPGTSRLAEKIAGAQHSLYLFQSLLSEEASWPMHITSTNFDEPRSLAATGLSHTSLVLHGFGFVDPAERSKPEILLGGQNTVLKEILRQELTQFKLNSLTELYIGDGFGRFAGVSKKNYVNRTKNAGVQIEMSRALRNLFAAKPWVEERFIESIRKGLRAYESCVAVLK